MNNKLTRMSLATTAICAAATLVACGGGGSSTTPTPAPATLGSVKVSLTDAPGCGFDAVNVTVSKVRIHQSATAADTDSGWTDITLNPARKINLMNLTNGSLDVLGTAPLTAGHYTQVRLVLDANTANNMANSVVPTGGVEKNLDTPSAVQSGLKLTGEFDVLSGQQVDMVIDFDACKSIVTKGNGKYALKPVIKLIPTVLNGISGVISPAILNNKVMISAQQNGVVIASTVPNATTGEFLLSRLVPGNYDVVVTADGSSASVIGTVPVASTTSTTAVSTTAAPITLATSLTGSIGGSVALATVVSTEVGYVAAKQSFAAGPTVTIKYAGADLLTSAYTIANLPLNAPNYAVYSATLPLVFAPATTVTPGIGKYTVAASAAGYTGMTFATPVDISLANATNINFALTP